MLSRCRKRVRALPNSEPLSVWMQRRGKGKLPRSPGRTRQTAAVVRASQDGSRQHAAAVVHQGELVAVLGKVLEVHLGPLPGDSLGIANPDLFRFARSQR